MSGYARTVGNKRGVKPKRKPKAPRKHFDPRMSIGIAEIKAQYPWLAEIGKVFR